MKVTIDRAKWNTGERLGISRLLDENGARCCLGFLVKACDIDDDQMLDVGLPSEVGLDDFGTERSERLRRIPSVLFDTAHQVRTWSTTSYGSDWENIFAAMNDAMGVDHETRESWIAEGFRAVLGCEVEFVGEYGVEVTFVDGPAPEPVK